jgi:hypothetical protein
MIVVTSEGLGRVSESDSNKYEDFSHGRILKKSPGTIPHARQGS